MNSNAPAWPTVLTALIAVYGAGLSTWLAIQKWREDRPRIRVRAEFGQMQSVGNPPAWVFLDARPSA